MKCEEVDRLIIDYLDLNLEDGLRAEIEKHLGTCERCLDEFRDIQEILNLSSGAAMATPDDSLKINFYHMLHNEIRKSEEHADTKLRVSQATWYIKPRYRLAAAVALLIAGTFIGIFFRSVTTSLNASNEIKQLQTEVSALKKNVMFTMLKDQSSSDRLQAVSYAGELGQADENVISILVETLNKDKNVNVRMAAAYALSKYATNRAVSDSLVKSLSLQTDPILQVTLINILAERKEKNALETVQKIIANKSTIKEVRTVAQNSLRLLI